MKFHKTIVVWDVGKFFTIFDPYLTPRQKFLPSYIGKFGKFLTPPPLKNANVLKMDGPLCMLKGYFFAKNVSKTTNMCWIYGTLQQRTKLHFIAKTVRIHYYYLHNTYIAHPFFTLFFHYPVSYCRSILDRNLRA